MIQKLLSKIKNWLISLSNDDPVQHCDYFNDRGCIHVDGPLCDFPHCPINRDYINLKNDNK